MALFGLVSSAFFVLAPRRRGSAGCNFLPCFIIDPPSPSQEKLAADSAGPAPAPELETLPEQVLQEVAPAPAHTEIDQLVADMQPLAQAATVDIAWLSQLGPFDAQQALALAASAGDALAQIRANTTALQDGVIDPFIRYWRARLSQTFVREIGQFGSRSYGLALATSDFDIVCNLQPGASRKAHFDTVLQHIDQDTSGAWTRNQKKVRGDTIQCKWMGVWVDFKASHGERQRDSACRSTDLMKVVVKHREQSQVDAVHAFKLCCHHLKIIQHHMEPRAEKFKAVVLCVFAFAALGNRAIGHLRLFEQTWALHEEIISENHPWYGLELAELWENPEQMLIYYLPKQGEIDVAHAVEKTSAVMKHKEL